jgi:hypothetical protein
MPFTVEMLPNYNMFVGYTGTTSVVTGTMTVASYTTTSITFTISSQTTGQNSSGNTVYISGTTLQSNACSHAKCQQVCVSSYSNVTVEPIQATFWGL